MARRSGGHLGLRLRGPLQLSDETCGIGGKRVIRPELGEQHVSGLLCLAAGDAPPA